MSAQTLARPLAARVASLPAVADSTETGGTSLPGVMRAAFEALDAGHTHYTDRPGIKPLREIAVARLASRYGVEYGPEEVTITCGATEARFVTVKQLVGAGKAILHSGDAAAVAGAAALVGATLTTDPDAPDIALVYISAATPDGQAQVLAERAGAHGWWILFDAGTQDAGGAFHPARIEALAPLTITVGSASEQLPGWRVGWLAGSKAANKLRAYKQSMTICTSSVSQWAALGMEDSTHGNG